MTRKNRWILTALLVGLFLSIPTSQAFFAAEVRPDLGMVIRLTGKVTYWQKASEKKPKKVKTFMKIRENDRFTLEPHAVVQLVYFSNGRKETWTGPGSFVVGASKCHPLKKSGEPQKPQVNSLPAAVTDEVRRVSPFVDPSHLHSYGGSQIRGEGHTEKVQFEPLELTEEEKQYLQETRDFYNKLVKQMDQDDIMPELYLFSILADYEQFEEMENLLEVMKKKQPENAGIDRLRQWLMEQNS